LGQKKRKNKHAHTYIYTTTHKRIHNIKRLSEVVVGTKKKHTHAHIHIHTHKHNTTYTHTQYQTHAGCSCLKTKKNNAHTNTHTHIQQHSDAYTITNECRRWQLKKKTHTHIYTTTLKRTQHIKRMSEVVVVKKKHTRIQTHAHTYNNT